MRRKGGKLLKTIDIIPKSLKGVVHIPPSKSISHRAIIAAALCSGESMIENIIMSKDVKATCDGLKSFGAEIAVKNYCKGRYTLIIRGKGCIKAAGKTIDCVESGSTLRFLIPIAILKDEKVTFTGRGKLIERPLNIYYDIFKAQDIRYYNNLGKLPLTIQGRLKPGDFYIRGDISSQFISGIMFALPLLNGDSRIIIHKSFESKGYVNLTIDVLKSFGIEIINKDYEIFKMKGNQTYKPREYSVEGDFSQAAFWLVAGVIAGSIECRDINLNSLQGDKQIIKIIREMGGNIKINDNSIIAYNSSTNGMVIDASQIPDLIPIISVMACLSRGTTIINNAHRLRIKESDRLKSIASELSKIGGRIKELKDGLIIDGVDSFEGGKVNSWNDHRIAMAMAIASTRCKGPLTIEGAESVEKSYIGFWKDFKELGGDIYERDMG